MADETTNRTDGAETIDAASIGKAANPISKATLAMIAAAVIFVIVAGVIITRFFTAPTGITGSGSSNSASRANQ